MKNRNRVTIDKGRLHIYWMKQTEPKIRPCPAVIKTFEQKIRVINCLGWRVSIFQGDKGDWYGYMENASDKMIVTAKGIFYDVHEILNGFIEVAMNV